MHMLALKLEQGCQWVVQPRILLDLEKALICVATLVGSRSSKFKSGLSPTVKAIKLIILQSTV